MTVKTYDVTAIGNAIVDVIAEVDPQFLSDENLSVGSMQLIDEARAETLTAQMSSPHQVSGGSAANTIAGMAALGRACGFVGQVADDALGEIFARDLRALGATFTTAPRPGNPLTARCLILVTPDGQRTMNTFLGASQFLPPSALDHDLIAASRILYLEGYLWDPEEPRTAMRSAISTARETGGQVAFTLSDPFCIERHGDDFRRLIDEGSIDILFGNEMELRALMGDDDLERSFDRLAAKVPTLIVTRGPHGAMASDRGERARVAAEPLEHVLDTTGAGDLFAAGFLAGRCEGRPLQHCLTMGAICAAEVISHFGPRPEKDLRALIDDRFGTKCD